MRSMVAVSCTLVPSAAEVSMKNTPWRPANLSASRTSTTRATAKSVLQPTNITKVPGAQVDTSLKCCTMQGGWCVPFGCHVLHVCTAEVRGPLAAHDGYWRLMGMDRGQRSADGLTLVVALTND